MTASLNYILEANLVLLMALVGAMALARRAVKHPPS